MKDDPALALEALGLGLVWVLGLLCVVRALGETLKHRYDTWTETLRRRAPGFFASFRAVGDAMLRMRYLTIAAITGVNAAIMTLVEPEFGFHGESARLLASAAVAIVANTILTRLLASLLARRLWRTPTIVRGSFWAVTIAVLGMLLSRGLRFVPGLLEGQAVEFEATGAVEAAQMSRVEALRCWLTAALAVAGWLCASLIHYQQTAGALLAHDAFAAVAVGGFGALVIDMIPLPALVGHGLRRYALRNWVALAAVSAAGFCLVVLPSAANWMEVDGTHRWVLIMSLFIVIAVLTIAATNRRIGREHLHGTPELEID